MIDILKDIAELPEKTKGYYTVLSKKWGVKPLIARQWVRRLDLLKKNGASQEKILKKVEYCHKFIPKV